MSSETSKLANKLSDASIRLSYSPFDAIQFPETLEKEHWHTSPELITLYGHPEWFALTETQQKVLSFYEAVNFYSLNINGEKALIEGLVKRLYDDRPAEHTRYIHHFLEEENKHMTFFGNFCLRYAGKVYQDRKLNFEREYLNGEEEFLFFLKVCIFEELADYFNVKQGQDERLHPVAQKINHYHHVDESRHLAFGRAYLKDVFDTHSKEWGAAYVTQLESYIKEYLNSTWREYYNPDVYQDAGFPNPYDLSDRVFNSPEAKAFRKEASRGLIANLVKCKIIPETFEF